MTSHARVVRLLYKDCIRISKKYQSELHRGQQLVEPYSELTHYLKKFKPDLKTLLGQRLEKSGTAVAWSELGIPEFVKSKFKANAGLQDENAIINAASDGFSYLSTTNNRVSALSNLVYEPSSTATTSDITVSVNCSFSPQNRSHDYHINITNNGNNTVQLLSRRWTILDKNGRAEVVQGDKVVGQSPILKPGQSHEYNSHVQIQANLGTMKGSYTFKYVGENAPEGTFEVEIAPFALIQPYEDRIQNAPAPVEVATEPGVKESA